MNRLKRICSPQTEPDERGWYTWSVSFLGELYAEGGCRTHEEALAAAGDWRWSYLADDEEYDRGVAQVTA